jgi:hypothetical protein
MTAQIGRKFFMTGNPFAEYIQHHLKNKPQGQDLIDEINVGTAEKRLFSEIYMGRNPLGIVSFSSKRTYEKTIHLPAVRRLLEAQGYEADEIGSMIDYMKRSFAHDASPELKAVFDEMDSIYDRLGGLRREDLFSLSQRLGKERIRVLAPNITHEAMQNINIDNYLKSYQYKFIFSETEIERKPIQRNVCRRS